MEDQYLDIYQEDQFDPCNQPGGDLAAWEEEQVFQEGLIVEVDDLGDFDENDYCHVLTPENF